MPSRPAPRFVLRRALRAAVVPATAVLLLGAPLDGAAGSAAVHGGGAVPGVPTMDALGVTGSADLSAHELASVQTAASYRYAFRIETDDDDPVRGVTYVSGDRSRIELVDDEGKRSSSYLLLTDGGRTLVAVDPAKREYTQAAAADFERIVGTAMDAVDRVMTLDVHDLDVTGRRLGAGERIAGYETQHSRLRTRFGLRIGAMGFNADQRHDVAVDYWVSPSLRLPRNPMMELFASLPTVLAQGDRDFVRRLRAGRAALVGEGTPLRVVVSAQHTDEDGDEERSRTVIEVADVRAGAQDATLFRVPDGYRKREGFDFSMARR